MSRGIRPVAPYRIIIARCLLLAALLSLILRAVSGLLPGQLCGPVLTAYHYDISMWLYRLSGLYRLPGNGRTGWLFEALLFGFGLLALRSPEWRGYIIAFTLLFFVMALHFNYFLTHGSHYLAGFVWILPVLWLRSDAAFEWGWEGTRYFTCWVFFWAFLMKAWHGALWQWDAGEITTRQNLALYLFQNGGTSTAAFYRWMLAHPWLLNAGHKLVALAEGAFFIGFFTKRRDVLLIVLMIFIQLSIYLFADVFFIELMVLALPLLPLRFWVAVASRKMAR